MPKSSASKNRSSPAGSDQKRARKRTGKSTANRWLFGHHAVVAALENPARTVLQVKATENAAAKLAENQRNAPLSLTNRSEIESLVGKEAVHQGIAAEVEPLAECHLEDIIATTDDQE